MNKLSVILKLFFLTSILFFIAPSQSRSIKSRQIEKPISLQKTNLTRWRNSPEALAIEQSIRGLVIPRSNYPRSSEPFENFKKYQSLYKTPFLVLEAEPHDFGGFWALVVFKGYPKVLCLWVYEIDKKLFEIREIEPLEPTLNKAIMDELEDQRINPFWVTL